MFRKAFGEQRVGEETSWGLDEGDDASLLQAIAARSDRRAFEVLYSRHERRAYGLAHSLTGNREMAEDALQSAMLRIWYYASRYRPECGSARGWILRIVANESNLLARKRRRELTRVKGRESEDCAGSGPGPDGSHERQQLLAALRGAVDQLPPLERRVVALYYVGGLSQAEIAEELACPRSTVNFKIKGALNILMTRLARHGLGAALLPASPEGLGEACCAAFAPGPGLKARILRHLAAAGHEAPLPRPSRLAGSPAGPLLYVAAALALLASGGLLYAMRGGSSDSLPRPTAGLPLLQASPARERPRIRALWNFEDGPLEEFKIQKGTWNWVPKSAGRPAGMLAADLEAKVDLPVEIPPGTCVEVTLSGLSPSVAKGAFRLAAMWSYLREPEARNCSIWIGPQKKVDGPNTPYATKIFLTDTMEVRTFWAPATRFLGGTAVFCERPLPRHSRPIAVVGRTLVQRIEVRELAPEEIPEALRDRKRIIREYRLLQIDPREIGFCFSEQAN